MHQHQGHKKKQPASQVLKGRNPLMYGYITPKSVYGFPKTLAVISIKYFTSVEV